MKLFPRFATFKEDTKLTYGCVFYFAASVTPYALIFFPWRKCGSLLGINICDFQEVVPSKH